MITTRFRERDQIWHTISYRQRTGAERTFKIGKTHEGTYVVLTGFFYGGAPDQFTLDQVELLADTLHAFETANP